MIIKEVPHGTPDYELTKQLRQDVLRSPIGLVLNEKDIEGEDQQIHIALKADNQVLGTVLLKPLTNGIVKLRQMAVASQLQGKGWGKALVLHAQGVARAQHFTRIELSARISAQIFYEKLGYQTQGEPFTEVGLSTIKMVKNL